MREADEKRSHDDAPVDDGAAFRLADVAVEWVADEAVAFVIPDERFVTLDTAGGELLEAALAELGDQELRAADVAAFLAVTYELDAPGATAAADRVAREWLGCGLLVPA